MSPAAKAARSPRPQKKSTRPAPRIAPPVSWFRTKRARGVQRTAPSAAARAARSRGRRGRRAGKSRASVATERPGVRGRPRLPSGGPASGRKKTYDSLCCRTRWRSLGVGRQPGADRLHRHRLPGHVTLLDQQPPDRPVRPAVGARVADPLLPAVREAQRAAPLDLHEEDVDRVARPRELEAATGEPARVDLRPPPVRHQPPALDAGRTRALRGSADRTPRAAPRSGRREAPRTGTAYSGLRSREASTTGS